MITVVYAYSYVCMFYINLWLILTQGIYSTVYVQTCLEES